MIIIIDCHNGGEREKKKCPCDIYIAQRKKTMGEEQIKNRCTKTEDHTEYSRVVSGRTLALPNGARQSIFFLLHLSIYPSAPQKYE